MLYVKPAPVGADTVIVPVALAQVGCAVTLAVGVAGVAGGDVMVKFVAGDLQPAPVLAVRLYVPVETPVKIPVVFE